jgi:hypothetical protein
MGEMEEKRKWDEQLPFPQPCLQHWHPPITGAACCPVHHPNPLVLGIEKVKPDGKGPAMVPAGLRSGMRQVSSSFSGLQVQALGFCRPGQTPSSAACHAQAAPGALWASFTY